MDPAESSVKHLPAAEVEGLVIDALRRFLQDSASLAGHFRGLDIREMQLLTSAANQRAALLNEGTARQKADLVRSLVSEVVVKSGIHADQS